jgi:hypothetical protein
MVPPNKELWSNGRTLDADDPSILGYREVTLRPEVAAALGIRDNDSAEGAPAGETTPGGRTVATPSPFIAGTQTESQYQASMQKEQEARMLADQLIDNDIADPKAEISDPIMRGRAIQIAKESGYQVPGKAEFEPMDLNKFAEKKSKSLNMSVNPKKFEKEYQIYSDGSNAIMDAMNGLASSMKNSKLFATDQQGITKNLKGGDIKRAVESLEKMAASTSVADQQTYQARKATAEQLNGIINDMAKLEKAGVKTNLLAGTAEQAANAVGKTASPELRAMAVRINGVLQAYRRNITGAAFPAAEKAEYDKMFPSISADSKMNAASVKGFLRMINDNQQAFLKAKLGESNYNVLYAPMKVETVGTKPVKGTIPAYEFDSMKYKQL